MAQEMKEQKQKKKIEDISILFLDVDGVLNTKFDAKLCPKMIKRLASIIDQTKCKLALSTSWRTDEWAKQLLFAELSQIGTININEIYIGDTPAVYHWPRAFEISQYLESQTKNFNILKWVAIDDMPLDKPLYESRKQILNECEAIMKDHFVRTNGEIGLTDENVKDVIALLI